jgi:hypothetical protein
VGARGLERQRLVRGEREGAHVAAVPGQGWG